MKLHEMNSEDDSSLDYQDLNSIDKGEAFGILASLGKRFYKSIGMGKSLDMSKLRQLRGKKNENSGLKGSVHSSEPRPRISRPDAASHFPFKDKNGGVQDVLRGSAAANSYLFRSMGLPARKKVATQVYHDNIRNGKSKLRLKDVPEALESLDLAASSDLLDDVHEQYLHDSKPLTCTGALHTDSVLSLEEWVLLVEDCLLSEQTISEEKEIEKRNNVEKKRREKEKEKERERSEHYQNALGWTQNQIRESDSAPHTHGKIRPKGTNTKLSSSSSSSSSSIMDTESSSRRSVGANRAVRAGDSTVQDPSVCDLRARSASRGRPESGPSPHTHSPHTGQRGPRPSSAGVGWRQVGQGSGLGVGVGMGVRTGSSSGQGQGGERVFVPSFTMGGMKSRVGQLDRRLNSQHTQLGLQQQQQQRSDTQVYLKQQEQRPGRRGVFEGGEGDKEGRTDRRTLTLKVNRAFKMRRANSVTLADERAKGSGSGPGPGLGSGLEGREKEEWEGEEEDRMRVRDWDNQEGGLGPGDEGEMLGVMDGKRGGREGEVGMEGQRAAQPISRVSRSSRGQSPFLLDNMRNVSDLARIRYDRATFLRDQMYAEKAAMEVLRSAHVDRLLGNASFLLENQRAVDEWEIDALSLIPSGESKNNLEKEKDGTRTHSQERNIGKKTENVSIVFDHTFDLTFDRNKYPSFTPHTTNNDVQSSSRFLNSNSSSSSSSSKNSVTNNFRVSPIIFVESPEKSLQRGTQTNGEKSAEKNMEKNGGKKLNNFGPQKRPDTQQRGRTLDPKSGSAALDIADAFLFGPLGVQMVDMPLPHSLPPSLPHSLPPHPPSPTRSSPLSVPVSRPLSMADYSTTRGAACSPSFSTTSPVPTHKRHIPSPLSQTPLSSSFSSLLDPPIPHSPQPPPSPYVHPSPLKFTVPTPIKTPAPTPGLGGKGGEDYRRILIPNEEKNSPNQSRSEMGAEMGGERGGDMVRRYEEEERERSLERERDRDIEREREKNREEVKKLYHQGWGASKGGWVGDFGSTHSRSMRNGGLGLYRERGGGNGGDGGQSPGVNGPTEYGWEEKSGREGGLRNGGSEDGSERERGRGAESSERELEWDKLREKERERARDKQRERDREREIEREQEREREHARMVEKEREIEREVEWQLEREREVEKENERGREKERVRAKEMENEREKDRERIKERERVKEREREKMLKRDRERLIEKEKEAERESELEREREVEREAEWQRMRDKERELKKERYRQRENEWRLEKMKEREVEIEREREVERAQARDRELSWQKEREEEREKMRKKEIEVEDELKLVRERGRENEREMLRERERELERQKERERELERGNERIKEREKIATKALERQTETKKEIEREKEREKDREKERDRQRIVDEKKREREREKHRLQEIEKEKEKEEKMREEMKKAEKVRGEEKGSLEEMKREASRLIQVKKENDRRLEIEREKKKENEREKDREKEKEKEREDERRHADLMSEKDRVHGVEWEMNRMRARDREREIEREKERERERKSVFSNEDVFIPSLWKDENNMEKDKNEGRKRIVKIEDEEEDEVKDGGESKEKYEKVTEQKKEQEKEQEKGIEEIEEEEESSDSEWEMEILRVREALSDTSRSSERDQKSEEERKRERFDAILNSALSGRSDSTNSSSSSDARTGPAKRGEIELEREVPRITAFSPFKDISSPRALNSSLNSLRASVGISLLNPTAPTFSSSCSSSQGSKGGKFVVVSHSDVALTVTDLTAATAISSKSHVRSSTSMPSTDASPLKHDFLVGISTAAVTYDSLRQREQSYIGDRKGAAEAEGVRTAFLRSLGSACVGNTFGVGSRSWSGESRRGREGGEGEVEGNREREGGGDEDEEGEGGGYEQDSLEVPGRGVGVGVGGRVISGGRSAETGVGVGVGDVSVLGLGLCLSSDSDDSKSFPESPLTDTSEGGKGPDGKTPGSGVDKGAGSGVGTGDRDGVKVEAGMGVDQGVGVAAGTPPKLNAPSTPQSRGNEMREVEDTPRHKNVGLGVDRSRGEGARGEGGEDSDLEELDSLFRDDFYPASPMYPITPFRDQIYGVEGGEGYYRGDSPVYPFVPGSPSGSLGGVDSLVDYMIASSASPRDI